MPNKRQALGRGLEALFAGNERPARETGVLTVGIDQIIPNPRQPRTSMNGEQLAELAASITIHGLSQPLVIPRLCGPLFNGTCRQHQQPLPC